MNRMAYHVKSGLAQDLRNIAKTLRGMVNGRCYAEQTLHIIQDLFFREQKQRPNDEPHWWLANAWLNYVVSNKTVDCRIDIWTLSLTETFYHGCIKPPLCARSLALHLVHEEISDADWRFSPFQKEYARLMGPVLSAQENGTILNLYARYNPLMSTQVQVLPSQDPDMGREREDETEICVSREFPPAVTQPHVLPSFAT